MATDARDRSITLETARRVYKVVFDPETLSVDEIAAADARTLERKKRLARAKPYAEFVATWSQKRPHPQALKFFGSWPDAKPNREVIRI